jgi:uncharacterized membrane protein required for colicin V production
MTDLAIVAVVVVYVGLGYWTGLVHRVIGLLGLYLAYFAATSSAPTAANVVLQAFPNWAVPDALMLGYFLVVGILLLIVEILAGFYHSHLQLKALLLDKGSGAVVGAITALVGITVGLSLLLGATQPIEGSPDGAQIQVHDAIHRSPLSTVLLASLGPAVRLIFGPVIPNNPGAYYNGQEARLQH